jgi:hypothetical protein
LIRPPTASDAAQRARQFRRSYSLFVGRVGLLKLLSNRRAPPSCAAAAASQGANAAGVRLPYLTSLLACDNASTVWTRKSEGKTAGLTCRTQRLNGRVIYLRMRAGTDNSTLPCLPSVFTARHRQSKDSRIDQRVLATPDFARATRQRRPRSVLSHTDYCHIL